MSDEAGLKYNISQEAVLFSTNPDDSSILNDDNNERPRNRFGPDISAGRGSTSSDIIFHNAANSSPPGTSTNNSSQQDDATFARSAAPPTAAPMTVSDAVEYIGMGRFQLTILCICGLFTFSDAMEMLLLAVLAPILKCEWLLGEFHVAFITTIVFIGYMLMAPVWGALSDHYGRRNVLVVVCLWIAFYGFLTAFSPTYGWVLILRGCVGAGIAGAGQAFVLTSEYMPLRWRARLLVGSSVFWTFGSLFEIGIAAAIVPNIPMDSRISGWRVLVIASSLPIALVALTLRYLPESARFLVAAGREIEAKQILEEAARINRQPKLPGPLKSEAQGVRGDVRELFRSGSGLATTTFGCWVLWFTAAFAYYGMILLSALLIEQHAKDCTTDPDALAHMTAGGSPSGGGLVCSCMPPSKETYISMLISTIGEFGSIILNLVTLDRFGRKRSMALYLALQGITFMLLIPCGLPPGVMTVLIFIIRGLSSAFFNAVYIYVAEIYPTRVRALALGSSSAAARIGAIITPFVAQVLLAHNRTAALVVYGVVSLFAAAVSLFMPIETKDRLQTT